MFKAMSDVYSERKRQIAGGYDGNDAFHTCNDWIARITAYAGRGGHNVVRNEAHGESFRANIVKTAALCLAAIEANDKGYC